MSHEAGLFLFLFLVALPFPPQEDTAICKKGDFYGGLSREVTVGTRPVRQSLALGSPYAVPLSHCLVRLPHPFSPVPAVGLPPQAHMQTPRHCPRPPP